MRRLGWRFRGGLVAVLLSTGLPPLGHAQEGAAEKVEGSLERAGSATKSGLQRAGEATGNAIGTVIEKTGEGIGTAIDATGRGLQRAGEAFTGGPKPTAAPLDDLHESDLPPEEPLVEPSPEYAPAPIPTTDPWDEELDPPVE
jgi:hypothetical protein